MSCLVARGHRVYAPSLTGLADRSHLLDETVNLTTHINDIGNLIIWEGLERIVLCGHSYSGSVVTAVADRYPEQIAGLVIFDGWIPENGKSALELGALAPRGGLFSPPPDASVFVRRVERRAVVQAKMTPQPNACSAEKALITGASNDVSYREYVLVSQDHAPFALVARKAAGEGWRVTTMNGGHDIMIDEPEQTSSLLEAALAASRHRD